MTEIFDSSSVQYSDDSYTYEGIDTTEGAKYQSGYHSIGYKYEFYNENSGTSFVINYIDENEEGIGLVRTPDMTCDIRTREQAKEGQHGVIGFRSFYGARALSFDCQIIAATAEKADKILDNIKRTLALPPQPTEQNKGDVRIRWTDVQGKKWQIYARITADPQPVSDMNMWLIHNLQLQLKAYDPVIYSQEESTITGHQGWVQGGFYINNDLPFQIPYIYNYKIIVDNKGTFQTPTVIKLYGYARKPAVYNISTGAKLTLDYEIGDGDYIIIDSLKGTITNSTGVDIASLTTSDDVFIFLQVGQNEIIYYDEEITNNPYLTGKSNRLPVTVSKTNIIDPTTRNRLFIDDFSHFNNDGSWTTSGNYLYETGSSITVSTNYQNDTDDYIIIENDDRASQDWTNIYDTGKVRLKVNIETGSAATAVTFYFGSSSSDYYYIEATEQYDSSAFADGENVIEFDLSSTSYTGTPDETDITYMAIKIDSDFGSSEDIFVEELHHYSDLWTLSGNSYDDTNYKLEDHGVKITSVSNNWSYAILSKSVNLANADLDDILNSYQYIDDHTQLEEYKIRFGDDTNYVDAVFSVPDSDGWINNKTRFENLTVGGNATISGIFDQIGLYAKATISGVVNVTYAGIYHLETDVTDALEDQAIIVNWREAEI